MGKKLERIYEVLEAVALQGRVSGYELKNILGLSLSSAQWWLSYLEEMGLARICEKEPVRRQRIFYSLTMMGFLLALKRTKVKRNFASVFEKFLRYEDEKIIDSKLKESTFEALKSKDVTDRFKELYIAISDAIDKLTDIYSIKEEKVIDLAMRLAYLNNPDRMNQILIELYPRLPLIQVMVNAYQNYVSHLDKILKGETQ